jgi:hypothetical protein
MRKLFHDLRRHCLPAVRAQNQWLQHPPSLPMESRSQPPTFWIHWLLAVEGGIVAFGMALVLAPGATRQAFSLLVYSAPEHIDSFGTEQVRYISLAHAVIGGVMVGWGAALYGITRALLARGDRTGWNLVALSVAAWFVPDTAYSLLSGYWQNALMNAVFLTLFAVPLLASRGSTR